MKRPALALSPPCEDTVRGWQSDPEEDPHQNLTKLIPDFQPPDCENRFLLSESHSVSSWYLVRAASTKTEADRTCYIDGQLGLPAGLSAGSGGRREEGGEM